MRYRKLPVSVRLQMLFHKKHIWLILLLSGSMMILIGHTQLLFQLNYDGTTAQIASSCFILFFGVLFAVKGMFIYKNNLTPKDIFNRYVNGLQKEKKKH